MHLKKIYQFLSVQNRSPILSYIIALVSTLVVLLIRQLITQSAWSASSFIIFLPAVVITSWYGGLLPGLVATVIATLIGDYFFLRPQYTFVIGSYQDGVRLILFVTISILISIINQTFYNQKEEKEQMLKKLTASENRFNKIANSAPVMLWILDEYMHSTFINSTLQKYIGTQKSNISWSQYMHPDDREYYKKMLSNAFLRKERFSFECRLRKANSQYHYVSVTGIPNILENQKFQGYIGTFVDVNETKELANQKTTFLSMVAHELRTPLATSQLINQLLLKKFIKEKYQTDIQDLYNMQEELDSLSSLVQELLYFVRAEQGLLPLHLKNFDYTALINTIVKHYHQTYPHVIIHTNIKNNYTIRGDNKRLKQVLYNLLDNAIHASHEEGNIVLDVYQKNNMLYTSIKDFGKGITQKDKKHIFNRYYQAADNMQKGFGLGLYIAKQIIQKHHGTIIVTSTLGKGSTFSFLLPNKKL